jgi:signal transduction histidine kinase
MAWNVEGDGRPIEAGPIKVDAGEWIRDERVLEVEGHEKHDPGSYSRIVIRTAVPLGPVRAKLQRLAATLAIVSLGIWLIAALLGRRYCYRALQPLADLTTASADLTGEELSRRLPLPNSQDEIDRLAVAFNGVLDRHQEGAERISRFVAEASHQLRTPLTRMTGHLEVALRKDRTPEEYQKTIRRALVQTQRMTSMVEALLYLARPKDTSLPLEVENVDLVDVVNETMDAWNKHPRFLDLQWQQPQVQIQARANRGLLQQAIDNLIDNALKYTPAGTPVTLQVGDGEIVVADQGPGIPHEERNRLFQAFQRGDRPRAEGIEGIGLGLAICRRIVRDMDGEVSLDDNLPGCRFRVRVTPEPVR